MKFISKHEELQKWADILDIEVVPLVYRGMIKDTDMIKSFLERESILGGAKIEGIVAKNYEKPFLLGGQPISVMSGKYVSEAFKEVHRTSWGGHTNKGGWELFKSGYRTDARWDKAIQHLTESGELTNTPKDIPLLIIEVQKDIGQEEKEIIKRFLWNSFGKELLRYSVGGLPEYYKNKLLERGFNHE